MRKSVSGALMLNIHITSILKLSGIVCYMVPQSLSVCETVRDQEIDKSVFGETRKAALHQGRRVICLWQTVDSFQSVP